MTLYIGRAGCLLILQVNDIARGLILGAQSSTRGTVINLGSGKDFSVNYLASLVSNKTITAPPRPFDMRQTLADTCKAKKLLQFQTQQDFPKSMSRLVKAALDGEDFKFRQPIFSVHGQKFKRVASLWVTIAVMLLVVIALLVFAMSHRKSVHKGFQAL